MFFVLCKIFGDGAVEIKLVLSKGLNMFAVISKFKTGNNRGVTLIELLIASTITVALTTVIFTFVSFSGDATKELKIQQQLQHESSIITESLEKFIRGGQFVTVGTATDAPTVATTTSQITVRKKDGTSISLKVASNKLLLCRDGTTWEDFSGYSSNVENTSGFTVGKNGESIDFNIELYTVQQGKKYSYVTTSGNVRCRNWGLEQSQTPSSQAGMFLTEAEHDLDHPYRYWSSGSSSSSSGSSSSSSSSSSGGHSGGGR